MISKRSDGGAESGGVSPRESGASGDRAAAGSASSTGHGSEGSSSAERGVTDRLSDAAQQATDQAYSAAEQAGEQIRKQSREAVRRQKQAAIGKVEHLGSALHRAADSLHEQGDDMIASYVDGAARRVKESAEYLQEHEWRDMMRQAGAAVRRHKPMALGVAFVAGLAAARFLKASGPEPRHERPEQRRDMSQPYQARGSAASPPPPRREPATVPSHSPSAPIGGSLSSASRPAGATGPQSQPNKPSPSTPTQEQE